MPRNVIKKEVKMVLDVMTVEQACRAYLKILTEVKFDTFLEMFKISDLSE